LLLISKGERQSPFGHVWPQVLRRMPVIGGPITALLATLVERDQRIETFVRRAPKQLVARTHQVLHAYLLLKRVQTSKQTKLRTTGPLGRPPALQERADERSDVRFYPSSNVKERRPKNLWRIQATRELAHRTGAEDKVRVSGML